MYNHLSMDKARSIQHLHDLGWSRRKIAATLAVDRKSVKRHLEGQKSKGAAPTGQALPLESDCVSSTQEEVKDDKDIHTPSPSWCSLHRTNHPGQQAGGWLAASLETTQGVCD